MYFNLTCINFFNVFDATGSAFTTLGGGGIIGAIIGDAYKLKNPDDGGHYLGLVLHNLWTTFNPGALVVGGSSCALYPNMINVARNTFKNYADSAGIAPALEVRTAHYGLLASAVGAAALVLHHELRPLHLK